MFIQGKIIPIGGDYNEALQIRRKVFVEEQGIPEEAEFDYLDKMAIHAVAYESNSKKEAVTEKRAIATGRLTFDGEICRLERVAVLKENRRKKYGDFIVRTLLNKAFTAGIKDVSINAQITAEEFYKKIGFQRTGDNFLEVGIWHCKMNISLKNFKKPCDNREV